MLRSNLRQFPRQQQAAEEAPPPERVARVHSAFVGEDSDVPLAKDAILKAYESERNRYVVLNSGEFEALRARASSNLEIVKFVKLDGIDRNYFEASYFVVPDNGGEKAYALFYRALDATGYVAIGELVMHGREHAVVIRPGGRGLVLHTLFFGNEVRMNEEFSADLSLVNEKELELAMMLVNAQRGTFDPSELKDKFKERVLELVDKRAGTAVPGTVPDGSGKVTPISDLMDALRKSVEAVRKPVKSETAERQSARKRRKGRAK